ncbi:gliding motility-associated ABC transporter ATP-binding subunit GldA [Bacteroidia bacterium]|nr:gliding motility-associated ABC transporter ATP-binding subunit GldA [Bacteroidia bacterium]
MVLEVQNISKNYGRQAAVKNVSFAVGKGEIVGFLGPNGAGKSTTMQIVAGCMLPDSGNVIKSSLGFLPEDNPLYEDMYVTEYLEYVAGLYVLEQAKEKVEDVIRKTGLQPERHKRIEQLSKGYRQRVGLAQAIIHQPGLLLLDEPTAGLDPNQTKEIHSLLLSLAREEGILFSSHTLSEVATICTRILFIHQGKIVADRPRNEIVDLEVLFTKLTKNENE